VTTSVSAADVDARRGLRLALAGVVAIFVTAATIGVAPSRSRAALYLIGLATIAALSIAGGALGRRALSAGTALRARAIVGAILGLWIGVTAAVLWFWTLVGIVL
jgi:hypothetical protein